jgi:hypothetical protein
MPVTHDSNRGRKTDCVGEVGHRVLTPRPRTRFGSDGMACCVPVQPARRLDLRLSNEARNPTVLAECCNGRSHPSGRKTGRHHEAHWLACLQTFLCNSVEGARCRCQNHPGAAQTFYVACFTRCLCERHDTGKARGAEKHYKLVVTFCYRELARYSDTAVSD